MLKLSDKKAQNGVAQAIKYQVVNNQIRHVIIGIGLILS